MNKYIIAEQFDGAALLSADEGLGVGVRLVVWHRAAGGAPRARLELEGLEAAEAFAEIRALHEGAGPDAVGGGKKGRKNGHT